MDPSPPSKIKIRIPPRTSSGDAPTAVPPAQSPSDFPAASGGSQSAGAPSIVRPALVQSFPDEPLPDEMQLRWRGRTSGPYALSEIERQLAAQQIGMLHEVEVNGRWITLREFFARRDARHSAFEAARRQEEQMRAEAARLRDEELRAAALAEEKRKNDILERQATQQPASMSHSSYPLRSHRGGLILTFAIIGLFLGPFALAAWIMGSNDLRTMQDGLMDPSGRTMTAAGRTLGAVFTILWVVGLVWGGSTIYNPGS